MIGQIILDGVVLGGIYALVSIGLTIIFGVMRIINFAHGEFLMLAMYATFWIFELFGLDPYVSVWLVAPIMFVAGVLAYRLILHRIIDAPELAHVFATLGLSIALQGLALFFWQADFRSVPTAYGSKLLTVSSVFVSLPRLVTLMAAVATVAGLSLFLRKTFTGKAIRAAAQDRVAAQLMGINLTHIYMITFGLGTFTLGLAGAVLMPVYEVFPTIGGLFVLVTFVVVILGGLGSIAGALVGGLLIGLIESISGFLLAPDLKEAVYFTMFVLILLFRPAGIFGRA
ncbi:MAG: branched-chain amino acid ABC transporter permease [Deltaproteobacteria bacterium]|nr:branched-chain amino acid ABC transporter permease [Deltaproteobacteria bacterium]